MSPERPRKKRPKPEELSEQQQAFIREYAICCNLEEAQVRVGYKPHHGNARRLLNDPRAQPLLKLHTKRANELADIHLAWIKARLKLLAIPNILDMIEVDPQTGGFAMDLRKVTRDQAYAIQELGFDGDGRLKIKLHDKAAVLRFLHDDMAPEKPARVRLEGPSGGPVEVIEGLGARLNAARARKQQAKAAA
jgi:hypothetical protein